MYLLILHLKPRILLHYCNLHPTMYLLILFIFNLRIIIVHNLHPTMYLLIMDAIWKDGKYNNLHPTMYLLISSVSIQIVVSVSFTSHYVSINLIHVQIDVRHISAFTSHYVSINLLLCLPFFLVYPYLHPTMYLLIFIVCNLCCCVLVLFTSHYVSIN